MSLLLARSCSLSCSIFGLRLCAACRRDLNEFLSAGGEAVWTMQVQLIPEAEAASLPYNILDVTKVVPHGDYPLIEVSHEASLTSSRWCPTGSTRSSRCMALPIGTRRLLLPALTHSARQLALLRILLIAASVHLRQSIVRRCHRHCCTIPLQVGKLVLNTAVDNFFAEVEQVAFSPGNLVPGIEPSTDRILQVSPVTSRSVAM